MTTHRCVRVGHVIFCSVPTASPQSEIPVTFGYRCAFLEYSEYSENPVLFGLHPFFTHDLWFRLMLAG